MNYKINFVLINFLFAATNLSGSDQIPAPVQDHPILLKGGIIHTVAGEILSNYDLLFEDGIIQKN